MAKEFQEELVIQVDEAVKKLALVDSRLSEINQKLVDIRTGSAQGFGRVAGDIESGEKALRGFLREQRFQDRVTREISQSIFNMAAAFSFLAGSGEGSLNRLHKGLVTGAAAANTLELTLFSVGQAGARMGGTMGVLLTRLSALGGPLALIVGLGAGLLAFFDEADKKAEKAADGGMKKFEDRLRGMSPQDQRAEIRLLESARKRLSDRVAETNRLLESGFAEERREQLELRQKLLQEEIERLRVALDLRVDILKATEEEHERIRREGGTLQVKELEITLLKQELEFFRGSAQERQALIDKIAKAEKELSEMRKTTADRNKEAQEKLNNASSEYAAKLEHRLALEKELHDLIFGSDITLPDVPLEEIARARAGLIDDDITRVRAEAQAERALIQKEIEEAGRKGEDTQLLQLKLVKSRKDEEKEIAEIQKKNFDTVVDRWERLLDILQTSMINAGDDFVRKMVTALQVAVQIAETLKDINAKKDGGDFLDTLTVIGQIVGGVAGILGRRAPGAGTAGQTASPARETIAGINLRRNLRPQIADAAVLLGGTQASPGDMSVLVREMQMLRATIQANPPTVILQGTMEGQTFLRKEMQKYNEHAKQKFIDG